MRNKRRRKTRKNVLIAYLLLFIFSLTIGFSSLNTSLKMLGHVKIPQSSWHIYFANPTLKEGSQNHQSLTLTNNDTSLQLSIVLPKPGDYYELSLDIVNDGTFDAKLSDISFPTIPEELQDIYSLTITNEDETPITLDEELAKKNSKRIKIHLQYNPNLTSDFNSNNFENLTLKFNTTYTQK